jgi:M6 family metalloprotease-like protein
VTEPGQPFGDPDQAKMQALLESNVYDIAFDYYWENSFQTLEPEFTVFGVHLGAPRPPLVLPRSFASYFYDDYRPGGIEALMPGNWASPPVLDGSEAMTVHTEPAFGTGKDYGIPFAALWTTRTHAAYPVAINFAGTETLQLDVEDQSGTTRNLNVAFGALALNHLQGDNEAAFLDALGNHVTDAIRAAETAAGSPVVVQDVIFRRIRENDDDTQFGLLQGQLRVADTGTQKGRITMTPPGVVPAALTAIGFGGSDSHSGVLGSAGEIGDYFRECLRAALNDAGEGPGLNDPQLNTTVETEEDAAADEVRVRINLATNKGGAGAQITLVSDSGLAGLGWPDAVPVGGSDSNSNNQNTMRYHQDLANDVFTAALDHIRNTEGWDADAVRAQFADFDAMMIGFVGACPTTVPVADRWDSADAVDFDRLRMFVRYHQATDLNNPGGEPVTMGTDLLIGQRFNQFDPGVMSHEVGHGLGLPDLYFADGFRDDVVYVDRWCQMAGANWRFNHFCAWSKWFVGWVVDDPGDALLNRVVEVPMPAPEGETTTEAWLYPIEYWDNDVRADVEAEVGNALPIGQMMKVHLGSDGGIVDLIELRAPGQNFSLQLPPTPAVIVTNVLQPGTDLRWAVNHLYRRSVHLLNEGRELHAVGDSFNFAAAPEFPVKGTVVELMDLRTIRGGSVPIARVKVVREAAEFIDLYFQDNVPSWKSPDIWVDWPGDNADPAIPREYPEGTPTDQGETVRFPDTGVEPHFLVVRPHNAGNVRAEDVKVKWFICDPPGAGDEGRWVERDTMTLAEIQNGTWEIAPFTWNVDPATNDHQCIRAEIVDWTIPTEVDPATGDTLALGSDDVILQNNYAQKNVFDFEAAT